MIKIKRAHKALIAFAALSATLSFFYTNAGGKTISVLRHPSPQPECYQYERALNGSVKNTQIKKHCPDKSNQRPYWTLFTVGWTDSYKSKTTGPSWDVWFTYDKSKKYISEFELRQIASPWWNDTSSAPEEPGVSKRCALREVGIGFDYADSGLARYKGNELTLNDFSSVYFGAEMKNTATNVGSTCVENPHDFLSLDFIYEYVVNGQTKVSNAVHLVVSKMNYRDNYGTKNDDILYHNCWLHREYGNYVCSTLVDASKWGVNLVGNNAESSFKNVNMDFLPLIKSLENRKLLEKCNGCTWTDAKIRHVQIINSTRGGSRMVKIKNPFLWAVPKSSPAVTPTPTPQPSPSPTVKPSPSPTPKSTPKPAPVLKDFSCALWNNNSGCKQKVTCPSGKKITGIRAACDLETPQINSGHINGTSWNQLKVIKASDVVKDGTCSVNIAGKTTAASSGTKSISFSPATSAEIFCKEKDSNGGDCEIAGQIRCE